VGARHARCNGIEGIRGAFDMPKCALLVFAAVAMAPAPALADQPTAELQALDDALPGTLINDPTRLDWQIFGAGQTNKPVKGEDIPGGKAATQITVAKAGATLFEVGANAPITTGIKSGTDVVVAFYARTVSAETTDGRGRIGVRFQQNVAPYSGLGGPTRNPRKERKP